ALPDGTRLLLDRGAVVNLLPAEGDTIAIQVREGRLLVIGDGGTTVANDDGAWASLDRAGVLGVFVYSRSRVFEAACLAGQCSLSGEEDAEPQPLVTGQGGLVGNSRRASKPENANYGGFLRLAPDRVPTPTLTATWTPTATPTDTATPRLYPTATATLTLASSPTASVTPPPPPVPTDEPAPSPTPPEPSDTPEVTDTPGPDTPAPTETAIEESPSPVPSSTTEP
ncbi:MAG: hypothetical protein KBG73_09445, partial [Candidatus Promineofilum sp.]|nr:hypothetical protein [Promineifilum sp.]